MNMDQIPDKRPILPPVGQRLLPQVVDQLASEYPERTFASYAATQNLADGFVDVSMRCLSHAVSEFAYWIDRSLGRSHVFDTLCYIGVSDIRYTIVFLATIKCGWKLLLLSPRNRASQNVNLLIRTSCKTILYSEKMDHLVKVLKSSTSLKSPITTFQVPLLHSFVHPPDEVVSYPYEKLFATAINDPILILHSSGSTGDPKLVHLTHGSFSVIDNARNVPVPHGREAQNSSLFNFGDEGGRFYAPFPPYHLAGVHSYVTIPIFSHAASLVLGPSETLPSGVLVSELMKVQRLRALYLPPSIIEQWMAEPDAMNQARALKFIIFGGGPLSPNCGDKLEKVTRLCQTYGSLETSGVQLLVPNTGEWSYLEFNPYEMCDMQEYGEGMYELVLLQRPEVAWMRALSHNFPDVKTWRTGDLFTRHPSIPTLWRFCSRVDDLIVMSNGLKLRPIPMELIVQGSPLVTSALIVGQGQIAPALIIEPSSVGKEIELQELYQNLMDVVNEANSIAPEYAQISSSRIIIGSSNKPFIRAPKGTVVRKLTAEVYASELEKAYSEPSSTGSTNPYLGPDDERFSLDSIKKLVREETGRLTTTLEGSDLNETDDFFMLGLDSLRMAQLAYNLRRELGTRNPDTGSEISLRLILRYSTIRALSDAIYSLHHQDERVDERPVHDVDGMKRIIRDAVSGISKSSTPRSALPSTNVEILLLGPRGSIGPNIIRSLLQDAQVSKIHCLNRSNDGRDRLRAIFKDRGFLGDFDDARLEFYPVDLGMNRLGLEETQWDHLRSRIHLALHNAWNVDFSLPLKSFEHEYIHSVRWLAELCGKSNNGARLVFCSSISSVQDWANYHPTQPVPEEPIGEEDFEVSSPLGYGQSKQVTERILITANTDCSIPVTILRIGQVAGPTTKEGGTWSDKEWIPALAKISKTLKMMPVDLPHMDWILSDTLGKIVRELILEKTPETLSSDSSTLSIFNLVNPCKVSPIQLLDVLRARAGEDIKAVTLKEWVDKISQTTAGFSPLQSKEQGKSDASLMIRMLPWFQHLSDTVSAGRIIQPDFATSKAARASPTMACVQPISTDLLGFWCSQWEI